MAADVRIDIAAQFVGKKAFKDAETSTDRLTKNVKGLAKGLLAVYSAQKILSYAKASVKAFAEDDKAATALGTTLKNLNLAYGSNIGTVNGYINRLEMQTGVLDDELRPAMDRFLRATLSVTKSQELLNLALDISAGTGKSLTQVSQSLQKAYLGQNQALGRLGVGLTKAELTSSSFEEIQARLATLFAGQATAAADTYAGSLAKLTVAGNNAKETIGEGLVDALKAASGSNTIDPVIKGIDAVANAIANLARETGEFIAITRENFNLKNLSFFYKDPKAFKGLGNISMTVSGQVDNKSAKAVQNTQTKVAKETLKANKESLKLAKARATFDLQKIQIEAALKGKISEEDKIRLKLMKAIEDENLAGIEKYQKALETAQTKTKELTELLATVKTLELKDPFGAWSVDPLTASINALTASMFSVQTQIQANGKEWSSFANSVATTVIRPNLTEWSSSFSAAAASAASATAAANAALTATTSAASKAAADAAAASAAAIASSNKTASEATAAAAAASAAAIAAANKASADAVAKAQAEAATTLGKLNAETIASTAAAAKAAQDAIDAANKTAAETVATILANASAAAAAKAAAAAAGNESTLEAFRNAEAGAAQTTATGGTTKIEVTVTGDPFTDPNAVAEKVVEIIREAGNRGTVDVLGFG